MHHRCTGAVTILCCAPGITWAAAGTRKNNCLDDAKTDQKPRDMLCVICHVLCVMLCWLVGCNMINMSNTTSQHTSKDIWAGGMPRSVISRKKKKKLCVISRDVRAIMWLLFGVEYSRKGRREKHTITRITRHHGFCTRHHGKITRSHANSFTRSSFFCTAIASNHVGRKVNDLQHSSRCPACTMMMEA